MNVAYLDLAPEESRLVADTLIFADERSRVAWGINLDFDGGGCLVGVEFEAADEQVPGELLSQARRL